MASPRIKKKTNSSKTSAMPRQAAMPCLVILALILVLGGLIFFFALRSTG